MMRSAPRILVVFMAALLFAACGSLPGGAKDEQDAKSRPQSDQPAPAPGMLIVNGKVVDGAPVAEEPKLTPAATRAAQAKAAAAAAAKDPERPAFVAEPLEEPPLNADGTLDDGPDPFAGARTQVLPAPIEDDAEVTRPIAAWANDLQSIEQERWAQWLQDRSAMNQAQGPADVVGAMVRVSTLRCGGASTVATGVVLADETVVTTVHAIESPQRRVRVAPLGAPGARMAAIIKYVDVDDDIAVLHVPGLQLRPIGTHVARGSQPQRALAFGVAPGGTQGSFRRVPVYVAMQEESITLEQADGLAQDISDRSVLPIAGGIDNGFSGGVVAATNQADQAGGWGFHGLVRARVPYRSTGGGVAIPSRLVTAAIQASERSDPWFELRPGACPQWHRPRSR